MLIKVVKNNGKFELYESPHDVMPGASSKLFEFRTTVLNKMNELNNYDIPNKIAQFINVVNVNGKDIYYYEVYCG